MDLALLLDVSSSMSGDLDGLRDFVQEIVWQFALSQTSTRVSIIGFNNEATVWVNNSVSEATIMQAVEDAIGSLRSQTCISCALRVAWSQTALQGREDAQPTFILLSDYYQTAGGTNDKAADEADVVKAGGGRILAVGLSEGGLDEVQAALVDEVASAPAEVYTSPLDAAADLLAALPSQVGAICTEVFLACVLSSHCAQPAVLAVHGQAFVA